MRWWIQTQRTVIFELWKSKKKVSWEKGWDWFLPKPCSMLKTYTHECMQCEFWRVEPKNLTEQRKNPNSDRTWIVPVHMKDLWSCCALCHKRNHNSALGYVSFTSQTFESHVWVLGNVQVAGCVAALDKHLIFTSLQLISFSTSQFRFIFLLLVSFSPSLSSTFSAEKEANKPITKKKAKENME